MSWRALPEERSVLYSPAWFQPVDVFSGGAPVEPLRATLDLLDGGTSTVTGIRAVVTPSGAYAYPGLGRSRDPSTAPVRRYRARFAADTYIPLYLAERDGEEFDAFPYDDTHPPAQLATRTEVQLAPAPGYRFSADVPTLYGTVVSQAGVPVAYALVQSPPTPAPLLRAERTLTDRSGAFALPLRWAAVNTDIDVVATDRRSQPPRTGTIKVRLPDALDHSHSIQIG
jgi:hypothetical protein